MSVGKSTKTPLVSRQQVNQAQTKLAEAVGASPRAVQAVEPFVRQATGRALDEGGRQLYRKLFGAEPNRFADQMLANLAPGGAESLLEQLWPESGRSADRETISRAIQSFLDPTLTPVERRAILSQAVQDPLTSLVFESINDLLALIPGESVSRSADWLGKEVVPQVPEAYRGALLEGLRGSAVAGKALSQFKATLDSPEFRTNLGYVLLAVRTLGRIESEHLSHIAFNVTPETRAAFDTAMRQYSMEVAEVVVPALFAMAGPVPPGLTATLDVVKVAVNSGLLERPETRELTQSLTRLRDVLDAPSGGPAWSALADLFSPRLMATVNAVKAAVSAENLRDMPESRELMATLVRLTEAVDGSADVSASLQEVGRGASPQLIATVAAAQVALRSAVKAEGVLDEVGLKELRERLTQLSEVAAQPGEVAGEVSAQLKTSVAAAQAAVQNSGLATAKGPREVLDRLSRLSDVLTNLEHPVGAVEIASALSPKLSATFREAKCVLEAANKAGVLQDTPEARDLLNRISRLQAAFETDDSPAKLSESDIFVRLDRAHEALNAKLSAAGMISGEAEHALNEVAADLSALVATVVPLWSLGKTLIQDATDGDAYIQQVLQGAQRAGPLTIKLAQTAMNAIPHEESTRLSEEEADRLRQLYEERKIPLTGQGAIRPIEEVALELGGLPVDSPERNRVRALRKLQDGVPPMSEAEVRAQVEHALGRPIDKVFTTFDFTPVASASIGQVHRAEIELGLLGQKRTVAVKVQRPGLDPEFARASRVSRLLMDLVTESVLTVADVVEENSGRSNRAVEWLRSPQGKLGMQMARASVGNFVNAFAGETDFKAEYQALRRFRRAIGGHTFVAAPRPYRRWSGDTVLTADFVKFEKLSSLLKRATTAKRVPTTSASLAALDVNDTGAKKVVADYVQKTYGLMVPPDFVELSRTPQGLEVKASTLDSRWPLVELKVSAEGQIDVQGAPFSIDAERIKRLTTRYIASIVSQFLVGGLVHGDPHDANLGVAADGETLVWFDFGNTLNFTGKHKWVPFGVAIGSLVSQPHMIANAALLLTSVDPKSPQGKEAVNAIVKRLEEMEIVRSLEQPELVAGVALDIVGKKESGFWAELESVADLAAVEAIVTRLDTREMVRALERPEAAGLAVLDVLGKMEIGFAVEPQSLSEKEALTAIVERFKAFGTPPILERPEAAGIAVLEALNKIEMGSPVDPTSPIGKEAVNEIVRHLKALGALPVRERPGAAAVAALEALTHMNLGFSFDPQSRSGKEAVKAIVEGLKLHGRRPILRRPQAAGVAALDVLGQMEIGFSADLTQLPKVNLALSGNYKSLLDAAGEQQFDVQAAKDVGITLLYDVLNVLSAGGVAAFSTGKKDSVLRKG